MTWRLRMTRACRSCDAREFIFPWIRLRNTFAAERKTPHPIAGYAGRKRLILLARIFPARRYARMRAASSCCRRVTSAKTGADSYARASTQPAEHQPGGFMSPKRLLKCLLAASLAAPLVAAGLSSPVLADHDDDDRGHNDHDRPHGAKSP